MDVNPTPYKKPKILFFDIETSNLRANIGRVLCIGYAFNDEDVEMVSLTDHIKQFRQDPTNDKLLIQDFYKIVCEADIVCGWYSRRFDWKFLNTRCLAHGLPPMPAEIAHLDLWEHCRNNFALTSNRLQTFQEFTHLEDAKTRIDFEYWTRGQAGHVPSLRYIEEHCYQDIEVLRQAYYKMLPYIKNHPTMKDITRKNDKPACPNCTCNKVQLRGRYVSKERHYLRYQCQGCGHWFRGPWIKPQN